MKVSLQIKRNELEAIKKGIKKTEWRQVSTYNKNLLLCQSEEHNGKLIGNNNIKEIEFQSGYGKNILKHTVRCIYIRPVKFNNDIFIKEDNFKALKGQVAIEIKIAPLGENGANSN